MLDAILALLPNATDIYSFFVDHANYYYVFVFMVIESSFIPFPSELVVPPAVYLACVGHGAGADMNPYMVVVIATLGALMGAFVNYYISLWVGRPLVYRFADSKFGHLCLIDRAKVVRAEDYFDRHGASSTLIGRLIPAVRQLISIPAGLARMNVGVFAAFTTLGALIWNTILGLLGYWLSTFVPIQQLHDKIEYYNKYLTWGGLAILLLCVVYILYKVFVKKQKN